MKSFLKYKYIVPALLAVLALASCTNEGPDEPVSRKKGDLVEVTVRLGVESGSRISRAAADTSTRRYHSATTEAISITYNPSASKSRAGGNPITEEQETTVNNLWILQFDNNGDILEKKYVTNLERIEGDGDGIYYKSSLMLEETGDVPATLFFIANASADAGFGSVTDLDGFKNLSHTLTSESAIEGLGDQPAGILMVGRWYSAGGLTSSSDITADVYRLAVKLSVNIVNNIVGTPADLKITSIQVQSVANKLAYYDRSELDDSWSWTSPDPSDGDNFFDYDVVATDFPSYYNEEEGREYMHQNFTWYVAENRQGRGNNILNQKYKWRKTDPSYETTGVSRATRIVMRGTYTKSDSDKEEPPRGIKITIYPGENIAEDFNVIRNSDYEMDITINTINEDDMRVELDPIVKFNYYVVDGDMNEILMYPDIYPDPDGEPNPNLFIGAGFIGNPDLPELDYTNPVVLNKYKGDIIYFGSDDPSLYDDGVTRGRKPTVVSQVDDENVVDIYYYKTGFAPNVITLTVYIMVNWGYHDKFEVKDIPKGSSVVAIFYTTAKITYAGTGDVIDLFEDPRYKDYFKHEGGNYSAQGWSTGDPKANPPIAAGVTLTGINEDSEIAIWYDRSVR